MPSSISFLFKSSHEYVPKARVDEIPARLRGIYVLYQENGREMNVKYVGMARGEKSGAKGRLWKHENTKADSWTHCSVYEVWDNITAAQIVELEGFVRHLYRKDGSANKLNVQRGYKPLHNLAKATKSARKATDIL